MGGFEEILLRGTVRICGLDIWGDEGGGGGKGLTRGKRTGNARSAQLVRRITRAGAINGTVKRTAGLASSEAGINGNITCNAVAIVCLRCAVASVPISSPVSNIFLVSSAPNTNVIAFIP